MTGATAIVSTCVKKEPVPRGYLIFDPETHSSRLLERVSPKMRLQKRSLGDSEKGQVSSPERQSDFAFLLQCPSRRPKDLTCQRVPTHLLPGLARASYSSPPHCHHLGESHLTSTQQRTSQSGSDHRTYQSSKEQAIHTLLLQP